MDVKYQYWSVLLSDKRGKDGMSDQNLQRNPMASSSSRILWYDKNYLHKKFF
jgi:hypothetical protein